MGVKMFVRQLSIVIVILFIILGGAYVIWGMPSKTRMVGGSHLLFSRATVVEVISSRALLVEIIPIPWYTYDENSPRGEYTLLPGDVVKVWFDENYNGYDEVHGQYYVDNDWVGDIFEEMVNAGTIIGFERFNSPENKVDSSKEPFEVRAERLKVYDEDGETILFEQQVTRVF